MSEPYAITIIHKCHAAIIIVVVVSVDSLVFIIAVENSTVTNVGYRFLIFPSVAWELM
jgi:hypothetical protein